MGHPDFGEGTLRRPPNAEVIPSGALARRGGRGRSRGICIYNRESVTLLAPHIQSAQVIVPCSDLQATLDFFVDRLGFRVDMIFPADSPSTAVISGHGVALRLEASEAALPVLRLLCDFSSLPKGTPHELVAPNGMKIELAEANPPIDVPDGKQEFVISRLGGVDGFGAGRAGMQYRDLIPSRLGGRFVASHIRIPAGGEVPDYVHYHRVRFQMIFCKAG